MKILHIGLCVYPKLEGLSLALYRGATAYKECRPESREIREIYDSFIPDLVFMQIQSEGVIDNGLVSYMAQRSIVINWTGDMRKQTPAWMLQMADHNRKRIICAFSNNKDLEAARGGGYAAEFLQIGIDPEIFKFWPNEQGAEIVYMANLYGHFPLSASRKHVAQLLKQRYGNRFKLFGNGWPRADGNLNGNQVAEARFYSGSKIGINLSNFNVDRYSSDRIFRIIGSGCFCLSHHYSGIETDFKVGQHLDTWRTDEDLTRKIDHYLSHADERSYIALAGYRHVHENFEYSHMVENIKKIYQKYK